MVEEAPWSARSVGAVELYPKPLSFVSLVTGKKVNVPANSFLLHGGSGAANDVWVSSDKGRSWLLAAGVTADDTAASAPYDSSSFDNFGAAAVLLDERSAAIYRIGGRDGTTSETDAVWRTTNGLQWANVAANTRQPFDSQRFYAGAVATSRGELILQGGTYDNFRSYRSDVWISSTQGRTWRPQTEAAAFGERGIGVLLTSQHDDRLGGADILYLVAGQNEKDNSNEVWVSSDGGREWAPVNLRAPFAQRDAFNGEITKAGVIVISAGLADRDVGLNEQPINDVSHLDCTLLSLQNPPTLPHLTLTLSSPPLSVPSGVGVAGRRVHVGSVCGGRGVVRPLPAVHRAGRAGLLLRRRRPLV